MNEMECSIWVGGLFGLMAGIWGIAFTKLRSTNKGYKFILNSGYCFTAISIIFISMGFITFLLRKPHHIYYPLIIMGIIGTVGFGFEVLKIKRSHADTELKKSIMKDLD